MDVTLRVYEIGGEEADLREGDGECEWEPAGGDGDGEVVVEEFGIGVHGFEGREGLEYLT